MAGAGFKTFGVGDVLTASDVNTYLMEQAVMTFASSGARGSAIGTASEGMLSYLADTDAVEVYDGSAWTAVAASPAGIGTNVVQTTKTDTYTTTSTSFGTVTGLTASITPTSSSSKVLIIVQLSFSLGGGTFNDAYGHFKVTRGGTDIYRGDAAGSRVRAVFGGQNRTDAPNATVGGSIVYLDSPATTSSTTYQVESRAATSNGGVYINRGVSDSDADVATRAASSITLIEVSA